MITVINRATMQTRLPALGVYVGRPGVLGNPYVVTTESKRGEMIAKYEVWLRDRMRTTNPVSNEIDRLVQHVLKGGTLSLECSCHPKQCHANVIKAVIEEELENTNAV